VKACARLPLNPLSTSAAVREQLVTALELDLVGPTRAVLERLEAEGLTEEAQQLREELLDRSPNRWYQTGFLIPSETGLEARADDTADDEFAGLDGQNLNPGRKGSAAADDTGTSEQGPARRVFFPSSIGLSALLPPGASLEIALHWASYAPTSAPEESKAEEAWRRTPFERSLSIPAAQLALTNHKPQRLPVPDSDGLFLRWHLRPAPEGQGYPAGAIALSLFLTNERRFEGRSAEDRDRASAYQVQMVVSCPAGFLPRSDPRAADRPANDSEWDARVNNLHYRAVHEFAVGHNIAISPATEADGSCHRISTTWLPQATVEKVKPRVEELIAGGVELSMAELDRLTSQGAEQVQAVLLPLVSAYEAWIHKQSENDGLTPQQQATATELLQEAGRQASRIRRGIEALADEQVRLAFGLTNRVMDRAARQRFGVMQGKNPDTVNPSWRPFQLAFLLMNLVGMQQPTDPERDTIDLLFFPTGGGKTEAYLGLAAYTLLLRRLRHVGGIRSAGMSVLMRYTLRLLTLDQLGRASTLICALELERRKKSALLGEWPFEIGLWVGQSGTPNLMGRKGDGNDNSARARVLALKGRDNKPIPIDTCPWCGVELGCLSLNDSREPVYREVFKLFRNGQSDQDNPDELRVCCRNRRCDFHGDSPLPLVAVDEMLYRRLPAFVIATVDKFAALPWVGATGKLFGRVTHLQPGKGFVGPSDGSDQGGLPLPEGLDPPDLIIQDELHLISGPLGSMGGLYEGVIDELSIREINGSVIRPKIVASTATVRRATQQMKALFARSTPPAVFPAPGPDRRDSFFSYTDTVEQAPGRLYLGISAPGRNVKALLLRVGLALMSTAQKLYIQVERERKAREKRGEPKGPNPVDPYMTFLGYFNTIKELGITRRLLEEEVTSQLTTYDQRQRLNETTSRYARRKIDNIPLELTSRVPTSEVSNTKARLALSFDDEKQRVDTVLATNMISVGLDISRLGLMVMMGQPKTTAEYIQASSRVGRDEERPGLVVVLLNPNRPRDRSHYERFSFWHSVFYRDVEATSVTPYSARALERGLPAVAVALARHLSPDLTWAKNAGNHEAVQAIEKVVAQRLGRRACLASPDGDTADALVRAQVLSLLDQWSRLAEERDGLLQYGREEGEVAPLLHTPLDPGLDDLSWGHRLFLANWSLRDVEPTAALVRQRSGADPEEAG
jgi:hypothetical protein